MNEQFHFFDQTAIVHRLSYGLKKRSQEVVFLVGAGLSAPLEPGASGVMAADGLIQLIRAEFVEDPPQLVEFDKATEVGGERKYQAAFLFLQGRLGQPTANEIVRKAVLAARLSQSDHPKSGPDAHMAKDEELRLLEFDGKWSLNPGTATIGKLITHHPDLFGRALLTTNFDPLIEIAIRSAGGQCFKTVLHADGNISQTEGPGCHVIHLHGYWYGSDTLHTNRQLQQSRPHLKASLASLLRNKLIVICGYGGWDDVFTDALMEVVRDDSASPEVLWTFRSDDPTIGESLAKRIAPGVDRGRVSLYANVDCNLFFPNLYEAWRKLEPEAPLPKTAPTNPVRVQPSLRDELGMSKLGGKILEGDDEDRPPLVEFCIGREPELRRLKESHAKVAFITGIGGQGKSTLAAQYFADSRLGRCYSYFIWRDCKEESERFENQLASVVETLSGGKISGQDLAKQDAQSIVQLLMTLTEGIDVLFVFDNADHYVNLDTLHMTASPDLLIQALVSSQSKSKIVLTCRPSVEYAHPDALSFHLEGLSLDATRLLFSERGAVCTDHEIADAHQLTNGHAFWLDLLSIQVTKHANITLGKLVDRIRSERGELPAKTLNSLWATLKDRERLVLRTLAETVRPETEREIADYLHR